VIKHLHRYLVFVLILAMLIPLLDCNKKPGFRKLAPTLLWKKDQVTINIDSGTKHMWSGLEIKNDFFIPTKRIAKFIIWKEKAGTTEIEIQYLLEGRPVELFINSKKRFMLAPQVNKLYAFRSTAPFSKGFNFLEFRQGENTQLKIKSIRLGKEIASQIYWHLPEGEKLTLFHPAGSGEISLKGKGQLHIKKVDFTGGQKNISETALNAGALSGSKTYAFDFKTMGFLQLSTIKGNFNISGYTFRKGVEEETSLKIDIENFLKKKPHIYIFLIDGCQTSHLGVYKYHRDTSPNIDRFSKDGVIFDNAYANASFTRSSVATIFTGFYPNRHKLRILTHRLPEGLFMLPEFLKKIGYKTALLTEAGNISEFFGFAQGIDNYRKIIRNWYDPKYLENNIFKFFTEWLKTDGPLFTYIHFRAPHLPITPPPPFLDIYKKNKNGLNRDRLIYHVAEHAYTPGEVQDIVDDYDSAILYVDNEVGKLLNTLKTKGLYDSSFIIFTSDHGEALYEHECWGHGTTVYDETSRVPLIVKFPADMKLGGRVEKIVQLVDIFPTFAALFGEKRYFDGRNLLESINIQKEDDSFAFTTSFGQPQIIGIRWRNWDYIISMHDNAEELFNVKTDPLKNVAELPENEDLVTFFRAKFLDWFNPFDNIERTSQSVDLKKLPKEEYENLKSLGYIN
jgi:arylsulfatase A-like enzyme